MILQFFVLTNQFLYYFCAEFLYHYHFSCKQANLKGNFAIKATTWKSKVRSVIVNWMLNKINLFTISSPLWSITKFVMLVFVLLVLFWGAFLQNFRTRKLGGITVFYAVFCVEFVIRTTFQEHCVIWVSHITKLLLM